MQGNRTDMIEGLNDNQKQALLAVINLMIPPSEDGRMPGASEVGFISYIEKEKIVPWVKEGLLVVIEEARKQFGEELQKLGELDQNKVIDSLRRRLFRYFSDLMACVIQCYYQHDQVLKGIGMERRPPFPEGYAVEDGDIMLLEAVYSRGKIFREVGGTAE